MRFIALVIVSLSFVFVTAAQAQSGKTATGRKTVSASGTSLKGVSAFLGYNFADSMDFEVSGNNVQTGSGTYNSDRAFTFGAQYNFLNLNNGLGFDAGVSYDVSRTINSAKFNGNNTQLGEKPEVQFWTMFGNASAYVTPNLGFFGGINYNIPTIRKAQGTTLKGDIGYQFGATYQINQNVAIDGQYRMLNLTGTAKTQQGTEASLDKIKLSGLAFQGRYAF